MFCLPPYSTHRAQSLDKGVFGPLKQCWRGKCHSHLVKNPTKMVSMKINENERKKVEVLKLEERKVERERKREEMLEEAKKKSIALQRKKL